MPTVLVITSNAGQDYATDHLVSGLREAIGPGNVRWHPFKQHLGASLPSDADKISRHVSWSTNDNRLREWGSWCSPPDCSCDGGTAWVQVDSADVVAVGLPVGDQKDFIMSVIKRRQSLNKKVVMLDGGDVASWPILNEALPEGPWFVHALPFESEYKQAFPFEYAFSKDAIDYFYRERDRPIDFLCAGSRHGGFRDVYVERLRSFVEKSQKKAVIRTQTTAYPIWADLLTRSKVHVAPIGADYVLTTEARQIEAAAMGCVVITRSRRGHVTNDWSADTGFLFYDSLNGLGQALEAVACWKNVEEVGKKARAHAYAFHQPVHRAREFLKACGL